MTHTFRKKPWIQNTERKWDNTDFVKKKTTAVHARKQLQNKTFIKHEKNYWASKAIIWTKIVHTAQKQLEKKQTIHAAFRKEIKHFFLKKKKKGQICN